VFPIVFEERPGFRKWREAVLEYPCAEMRDIKRWETDREGVGHMSEFSRETFKSRGYLPLISIDIAIGTILILYREIIP
jgi:hypothetical protein